MRLTGAGAPRLPAGRCVLMPRMPGRLRLLLPVVALVLLTPHAGLDAGDLQIAGLFLRAGVALADLPDAARPRSVRFVDVIESKGRCG